MTSDIQLNDDGTVAISGDVSIDGGLTAKKLILETVQMSEGGGMKIGPKGPLFDPASRPVVVPVDLGVMLNQLQGRIAALEAKVP